MITLFIDTSFKDVSIALLKEGKIISKIIKNIPNEHSKYAVSYIDEVIKDAKLNPNDINLIMVTNGPGSFTGIRIGLTIAKIYAYLTNIKVVLVSSLKALALSVNDDYILSLIDARNDNYYMALYDKNYNEVVKEQFANITLINELIQEHNPKIVSMTEIDLNNYYKTDLDIEKIYNYYKDKEQVNAHKVLPNYLKLPQVLEK